MSAQRETISNYRMIISTYNIETKRFQASGNEVWRSMLEIRHERNQIYEDRITHVKSHSSMGGIKPLSAYLNRMSLEPRHHPPLHIAMSSLRLRNQRLRIDSTSAHPPCLGCRNEPRKGFAADSAGNMLRSRLRSPFPPSDPSFGIGKKMACSPFIHCRPCRASWPFIP